MKQQQSGIGAAGVIIVILVVIVLALGGALAYKVHEDRSLSSTNNVVPNNAQPVTDSSRTSDNSQTTKVAAHTLEEGNTFVENMYQQYIQTQNNSRVGAKQGLELIKDKLTPDLYNTISAKYGTEDSDQIICAQSLPSTFGVTSNDQAGGSANYTVDETFGTTDHLVKVTVDLNQLLVSNITCPV